MKIIWCLVPDIKGRTDRVFCHFGILSFFTCVPQMAIIWCMVLGHFLPFYSTNNQKYPNFEKMKKSPGHIIILDKCTKNHDCMLYCSWDMTRDGCNYFSFLVIFYVFTHLTGQKIKIKKKNEKNTWRYHCFASSKWL